MADDAVLAELLSRWEREQARGRDVPVAELCRDCPELAPEVEQCLRALRGLNGLVRAAEDTVSVRATEPHPAAAPLPSLPGYEVLGKLGEGGMGVVFRARDLALKRLVAIKQLLHPAPSAEGLARFRAEAEALARLRHPHVVQVHAAGEQDGRPYFVMEYVEGGGLDQKVQGRPQPPADAARLVMLLARAVGTAHRQGIVHRDLKPANILLAPPADEPALNTAYGLPKVSDFGLSKTLGEDQGRTAGGTILGTPGYMAPEQAAGRPWEIGPATDVYALGAILYELLTGHVPFRGRSVLETLEQVRTQPPRPPRELRPDVPAALEAVSLRCLAKAPADRYPTAQALADDLQRYPAAPAAASVAPTKVLPARRPSRPPLSRRHLAVIAGGVMGLLALAALIWWPRSSPAPQPPPTEPAAAAPAPLKGWVDVRVWKGPGKPAGPGRRLHEKGVLPLREHDWVRIDAELNRPAFLYVIWLDSAGKATPIYPWRNENWRDRPDDERAVKRLALPGEDLDAAPLGGSPSGVESILLLAREERLPPAEDGALAAVFRGLPRQERLPDLRAAAWFERGELVRDEEDRGAMRIGQAEAVDDPVLRTQRLLRGQLGQMFSYTRAVCYGFQGE
jgi:serine/threonine protein kinase